MDQKATVTPHLSRGATNRIAPILHDRRTQRWTRHAATSTPHDTPMRSLMRGLGCDDHPVVLVVAVGIEEVADAQVSLFAIKIDFTQQVAAMGR